MDLGSGCGIVAIMLALQRLDWQITGLEIQEYLVDLAKRNSDECDTQIDWLCNDLKAYTAEEPFDLIVSNPPWQKQGSGTPSPHPAKNISRVELLCSLADVMGCVWRNMSRNGTALLLYPAERSEDLRCEAEKTLLDIISMLPATGLNNHVICHVRHKGTSA